MNCLGQNNLVWHRGQIEALTMMQAEQRLETFSALQLVRLGLFSSWFGSSWFKLVQVGPSRFELVPTDFLQG